MVPIQRRNETTSETLPRDTVAPGVPSRGFAGRNQSLPEGRDASRVARMMFLRIDPLVLPRRDSSPSGLAPLILSGQFIESF
jgi:hypothetical protein